MLLATGFIQFKYILSLDPSLDPYQYCQSLIVETVLTPCSTPISISPVQPTKAISPLSFSRAIAKATVKYGHRKPVNA